MSGYSRARVERRRLRTIEPRGGAACLRARVELELPEAVILPAVHGNMTRMRAVTVSAEIGSESRWVTLHGPDGDDELRPWVTLHGPALRKNGELARTTWASFALTDYPRPDGIDLIPDADWATIRLAERMARAMDGAARAEHADAVGGEVR